MRTRSWTDEQLRWAVAASSSQREVLGRLGLRQAGGNYAQLKKYVQHLNLDTSHLKARAWNRGLRYTRKPAVALEDVLKKRLIAQGLLPPHCQLCGWAERSADGRIPIEIDHINGDRFDNRLENLRILCPNCHRLQPTHRGCNKRKRARVVE